MILTTIEAYIESFICHYDSKDRGIGGTTGSDPTVWRGRAKKVERISCGKKNPDNYDCYNDG